jgi:hypothetical protein
LEITVKERKKLSELSMVELKIKKKNEGRDENRARKIIGMSRTTHRRFESGKA